MQEARSIDASGKRPRRASIAASSSTSASSAAGVEIVRTPSSDRDRRGHKGRVARADLLERRSCGVARNAPAAPRRSSRTSARAPSFPPADRPRALQASARRGPIDALRRRPRKRSFARSGDKRVPEIGPFEMKGRRTRVRPSRSLPHRREHRQPVQPLLIDAPCRQPLRRGRERRRSDAERRPAGEQRRPIALARRTGSFAKRSSAPARCRVDDALSFGSSRVARMLTMGSEAGR